MASGGSYCLCLRVDRDLYLGIRSLGVLLLPAGRYIYVGSALRGLEGRLRRHMDLNLGRRSKTFWHIDHLLIEPGVEIEAIFIKPSDRRIECEVASSISKVGRAIEGFGCSDCRCRSHLFQVDDFRFLSEVGFKPWFDGKTNI